MKIIFLGLVLSTLLLSGCGTSVKQTTTEKIQQNTVTKVGIISAKAGDEYLLSTTDGIYSMASNKVNLDSYIKKKVTVTGMFSGSTLYVDEIK